MQRAVTAGTIGRTIALALALINQALSMMGRPLIPIDDKTMETAVTLVCTIVASLVAWWKNNSFTQEAIEADEVLAELKAEKK